MLGFWIIITHLVGAYLTSSAYIQSKAAGSTTFAAISAVLYMVPFVLFLPGSILSFIAVLLFRIIVVRLSLVDYIVWAKNLMAPRDQRVPRMVREGVLDMESAPVSQVLTVHIASIALHCIFIGIALIVL